ncbi:MAG: aminopeptidase [Phascolarctobacterium sp.]|nr:aminopeptidase [Phascolarctobacterium sp.]
MTTAKELQKSLSWEFPHIAKAAPAAKDAAYTYCEGYKEFLNMAKTEREFTAMAVAKLQAAGYTPFEEGKAYKPGDKVYYVNRGKSLAMSTFGTAPLEAGIRLNAAHIDSPRLDLKPNPVYENHDIAYFKTHYYGGIRKYQWVTTPLAMHGVIIKKSGEMVTVCVGEQPGEPQFCVTDLLPHLGAKQNERKLSEGIAGEELNIVIGSLPFVGEEENDEVKEAVKLTALSILNEMYGITEHDFMRAEIEFVPAVKAVDIGLDRSLIGAYGQDDKVCAYTALTAEIDTKAPYYTTVTILADKEEIGSYGNTGLNSDFVLHYIEDLAALEGANIRKVLRNTTALSSDVNGAYDPTFASVYEERNSCFVNKGPCLTKYTGARGKSGSNDASAETMAKIISIMDEADVYWQIGELGKVDEGGGGTVALYVASMDMDVVDLGVPVLCMHSPFELTSKLDVYYTYKAFAAFLNSSK